MSLSRKFKVTGMYCKGCETIIEDAVALLDGIQLVRASFQKGIVTVIFDSGKTSLESIHNAINTKGYKVVLNREDSKQQFLKIALSILVLAILLVIILLSRSYGHKLHLPVIDSHTGDGLIFIVGLLTGLHCIGMCGSFVIGYTAKDAEKKRPVIRSHLLYGIGKIFSYSLFGALFGLLGSLFTISPLIGGITISIAGIFLILYGLNMLNILSLLKSIRFKQPSLFSKFVIKERSKTNSPLFIGFFSGFILGCGPLQAMYVMAAGNGNVLQGAKILALFGFGTLPALFGFGMIARFLSNRMSRKIIHASGIILIVLGAMMLNRGIIKAGINNKAETVQQPGCCHSSVEKN